MNILVFGEILWDIIEEKEHLGGAPLNFAAHTAQLGNNPSIISAIGRDRLGTQALQELSKLSIDTQFVQVLKETPTGTVQVKLDNGQPRYEIIEKVAYDYISFDEIDTRLLSEYDVFYFGTLAQRSRESRDTLAKLFVHGSFQHIFCDLNLRKGCYSTETITSSIEQCTILKLNDEEVEVVSSLVFDSKSGDPSEFWKLVKDRFPNVEIMIVTLGKEGCQIMTKDVDLHIPAEPCQVKDTIGAGDAFSAAFVSDYLTHGDLTLAGQKANKVAAFVASSNGAIPQLPADFL
ncbi:fructokinase [Ekhidna lutea]|uniref:Fructokinase n=1 Tax=Ekhidna lutea TaxID=447679 RepID=A0A239GVP2_EKHLU|nr:carbohydrate kinase [Ekhidna lutea]SNS73200.1 fructokinase [Ekhidna lutea]